MSQSEAERHRSDWDEPDGPDPETWDRTNLTEGWTTFTPPADSHTRTAEFVSVRSELLTNLEAHR